MIDDSKINHTVSHIEWVKNVVFHDRARTVSFRTLDGKQYFFDMETGERINSGKYNVIWLVAWWNHHLTVRPIRSTTS
ncbi:hypothetical protein PCCS19_37180 [Paenibacillus sp. CCS19]|nr:hypothetical protein PCCS19_37180 [Paenibacillus cellulosilyticus]